ncbi:MAG: CPBP family intramembrane glutamic endopeptidase [Bacteroidota bacterium]
MNRPLALFLLLAFCLSWVCYFFLLNGKAPQQIALLAGWGPGMAAVLTSLIYSKPLKQLGLALQKPSYLLAGYFLPLLYAIPVYAAIWLFGIAGLNNGFEANYLKLFTLGHLLPVVAAIGEELGWRGFLYPKLTQKNGRFMAALLTGLIISVWHFPAVIAAVYQGPPTWYVLSCYTLTVISLSFLSAWLRDRSGSTWPGVLLQASHHFYISNFLNQLTNPSLNSAYVYGEFGIGLSIATFVIASLLWLKHEKTLPTIKQYSMA